MTDLTAFDGKPRPRYFSFMGWSYASLGLLGLVFGLLSLAMIPGALALKKMILNPEEMRSLSMIQGGVTPFPTELTEFLLPIINFWIPGSLLKIFFSGLLTYASFMFMKGKRWAYLSLLWFNYFLLAGTVGGYYFGVATLREMLKKLQGTALAEELGMSLTLPSYFNPALLAILILLVVPFIMSAWYFHWRPVREYFAVRPASENP